MRKKEGEKLSVRGLICAAASFAAAASAHADSWTNLVTPYIWGTHILGTSAVGSPYGPIGGNVDIGTSQVLEHLKLAGMVTYRGQNDQFVVIGDVLYAHLGASGSVPVPAPPIVLHLNADQRLTVLEGDFGYRLTPLITAFAGLRNTDASTTASASASGPGFTLGPVTEKRSADWVDPVVGLIGEIPLDSRWAIRLRGDVGGFSVGAKFAWQGVASVSYQVSSTIFVGAAYRYLREDYTSGSGSNYYQYDMALSGPAVGVSIAF